MCSYRGRGRGGRGNRGGGYRRGGNNRRGRPKFGHDNAGPINPEQLFKPSFLVDPWHEAAQVGDGSSHVRHIDAAGAHPPHSRTSRKEDGGTHHDTTRGIVGGKNNNSRGAHLFKPSMLIDPWTG